MTSPSPSLRVERLTRAELLERAFHETDAFLAAVDRGAVYVVERFVAPDTVAAFRAMAGRLAAEVPPSWHACLDGVPDYHRVVDEYPGSWVRSRMHAFYFHRFNGNARLFEAFGDIFALKAHLAGEPLERFLGAVPSDGVIARVVSNHYPRGGGYLAEHVDPAGPYARLQTIVQASAPGTDFTDGGLYVRDSEGAAPFLIDPHTACGDLMVLSPAIPHGVAPIDLAEPLEWGRADGRWMILPIFLLSDHDPDRARRPRQL